MYLDQWPVCQKVADVLTLSVQGKGGHSKARSLKEVNKGRRGGKKGKKEERKGGKKNGRKT